MRKLLIAASVLGVTTLAVGGAAVAGHDGPPNAHMHKHEITGVVVGRGLCNAADADSEQRAFHNFHDLVHLGDPPIGGPVIPC